MEFSFRLIITFLIFFIVITLFEIFLKRTKIFLLKRARNKKQVSNIKFFSRTISIFFLFLIFVLLFLTYIKSWTGLSLIVGLMTAGLGFALQKPITGIAAWIMMTTKRPFSIGDRVIIGEVRGDVYDITLTHIFLDEVGSGVSSGEPTGRNIMVPNHLFFEHNIINYTLTNDFVLCSTDIAITYESNLDKAIKIIEDTANKHLSERRFRFREKPFTRIGMQDSSMSVSLKFYVPAREMLEVKSKIIKEVYDLIKAEKDVEIAYPHTQIVLKEELKRK